MKILYLTFYFEPDLCAGSFRNTPIVQELSVRDELKNGNIDVLTTMPNRYSTYRVEAQGVERKRNITIRRISLPNHKSGLFDQIRAFQTYFFQTLSIVRSKEYDLVVASSSRLFTAFLGALIARKKKVPLFLDIRDLFRDTITDIYKNRIVSFGLNKILKFIENYTFGYASHINLVSEGFKPYFRSFEQCSYSYHTNGIDDIFLSGIFEEHKLRKGNELRTIVYAGNIGEGQGLHDIIPEAAAKLEGRYEFLVIGDGGAKSKLIERIESIGCTNVQLLPPMKREKLIERYHAADFLFVHLNDLKAFEKVLPSKIFEYGAFSKPLIAGLSGYAAKFVKEHVSNHLLFPPCNVDALVNSLNAFEYEVINRTDFIKIFSRQNIVERLVDDILLIPQ